MPDTLDPQLEMAARDLIVHSSLKAALVSGHEDSIGTGAVCTADQSFAETAARGDKRDRTVRSQFT